MRLLDVIRGRAKTPPDPLVVPLGEGEAGRVEWRPSEGSGHLLLAGGAGSGSGMALLGILAHLSQHPDAWKAYLVDPKGVEFSGYEKYPAVESVSTDPTATGRLLGELRAEMGRRYELLADAGVGTLGDLNTAREARAEEPLPYIMLMVSALEESIAGATDGSRRDLEHLLRLGRGAGVHAVLAARSPDVEAVAGLEQVDAVLIARPGGAATYRDSVGEREVEIYRVDTADLAEAAS